MIATRILKQMIIGSLSGGNDFAYGLDALKDTSPGVTQTYYSFDTDKLYYCEVAGAWIEYDEQTVLKDTAFNANVQLGNAVTAAHKIYGRISTWGGASGSNEWQLCEDISGYTRQNLAHFSMKLMGDTPFSSKGSMQGVYANVQIDETGADIDGKIIYGGELKATSDRNMINASEVIGLVGRAMLRKASTIPIAKGIVGSIDGMNTATIASAYSLYAQITGASLFTKKAVLGVNGAFDCLVDFDDATTCYAVTTGTPASTSKGQILIRDMAGNIGYINVYTTTGS